MDVEQVRARLNEVGTRLSALGVASLSVFGSAARGTAKKGSDLDFLVEFKERATFNGYMELKERLEREFGAPIDLVTVGALKPAIRDQILGEAVRVA